MSLWTNHFQVSDKSQLSVAERSSPPCNRVSGLESDQFSSVAQSCPTLCHLMDSSTPDLPVHQQLLRFTQTHVHWVGDAIQPSHPLLSPSPPAFNLSQHQGLFECQFFMSGGQSIGVSASAAVLPSLLQHHSSKASILWRSAFFIVQPSHPYMTAGKTITLTRRTFAGKVMSLLFNMLSRLVITFLPRSKHLLISWLQSPSAVILEPKIIKACHCFHCFPIYLPWSDGTRCHDLSINKWVQMILFVTTRCTLNLSCKEGWQGRGEDSQGMRIPTLLQNPTPIPRMKTHPLFWPRNKRFTNYPERLKHSTRSTAGEPPKPPGHITQHSQRLRTGDSWSWPLAVHHNVLTNKTLYIISRLFTLHSGMSSQYGKHRGI